MKKIITVLTITLIGLAACNKSPEPIPAAEDFTTAEQKVLTDFVDVVAIPQYGDLAAKGDALDAAIVALNANASPASLNDARAAWLDMRKVWEQCEGFLFGPVEDDEYDPQMDTWPTDYIQMDSLLTTATPLTVQHLQSITLSLRGFHPIEYILFGNHGDRQAADITMRQKEYLLSLSADLKTNCHALSAAWSAGGGNYGAFVKTAGAGSSKYSSRRELFLAITDGLTGIADEVGEGKMLEPYITQDPKTVESPYSGNSVTDFRNNITGLENVYLGRYANTGKGLSDLVRAKNAALDNKIRQQTAAAIASFGSITLPYEIAISSQRTQIQNTRAALAALRTTLESELRPYVMQYIKD